MQTAKVNGCAEGERLENQGLIKIILMKKILFVSIFAILLCFASCKKMRYGNITEMWYEPESHNLIMMPIVISTGKTTMRSVVPMMVYDNEDWCIKVRGVSIKGDTITRTYYIPKESYDTMRIGKFICVDGQCDEDTNNKKVRQ